MATLTPLSLSRLQTPSGSLSDVSDCTSQSSDYGYSALHDAVISHDLEYLDFQLGSGCELDQRDENGFTALHVAVLQKYLVGVQRLVDAGCNLEKPTKEGMSVLHIAVDLKDNDDIFCFLASSVPNINIKNKVGRTALHLSAKSGHQEYLKILLDYGCDRDIKDKFGKKAVDIARTNNHVECVEILLNYIAKKRILRTCKNISTTKQQNTHGGKISLKRNTKKKRTIEANRNESSNGTTFSDNVINSSVFQINIQNVDLPDKEDNIAQDIPGSLSNINNLPNGSEQEETTVPLSSSYAKTNEFATKTGEAELQHEEKCIQDVPALFTYRLCTEIEEEKHNGFVNPEKAIKDEFHHSVACSTPVKCYEHDETPYTTENQSEGTKDDIENNNNWNPNCYLFAKELENQRDKQKDNLSHILPKKLSSNICHSSLQPHISSPFLSSCEDVDKNIPGKNGCGKYHKQLVHFDPYNEKDMFILISAICGLEKYKYEFSSNAKRNSYEYNYVKNEVQAFFGVPKYNLNAQNNFCDYELQSLQVRSFSTVLSFRADNTSPSDVLYKLLQGIKGTLNGTSRSHGYSRLDECCDKNGCHGPCGWHDAAGRQGYLGFLSISTRCSNCSCHGNSSCYGSPVCHNATVRHGNTLALGTKQRNTFSGDPLELFFKAAHLITTNPDEASSILDKVCNNLDVTSCKSLVLSIFTQAKLLDDSSPVSQADSDSVLHAFEYALQQKKTAHLLAAAALDVILIPQNGVINSAPLLKTNPEFVEKLIRTASEEMVWIEDKVSAIFIQLCDLLSDEVVLLYRYVDALLGTAFHKMNHWTLSSCILVRMGLLKSEFEVKISRRLNGPLLALAHVFEQDYFPSSLACLYVSFLTKESSRFRTLERLRENALKAAMLREILQPNMQLGKGLKRIADVLAHGQFCGTAFQCCKALFEFSFSAESRFTSMEQGSSILIYFGLIKSEFPVEVVQNLQHGLKLLLHAASNGYIPQSIAPMIAMFLLKGSFNILHSCRGHAEQIVKVLRE